MNSQHQAPDLPAPGEPVGYICDACRNIDFKAALAVPAAEIRVQDWGGEELDSEVKRFASRELRYATWSPSSCQLCRILSSTARWYETHWTNPATQARFLESEFTLSAYSYIINNPWSRMKVFDEDVEKAKVADLQGVQDYHILLSIPGISSSSGDYHRGSPSTGEAGYVLCLPPDVDCGERGLFKPQAVPDKFDHQKAHLWLDDCRKHHGNQCNIAPIFVPRMKLVDINTLEIVEADESMQWVALSYVWGPREGTSSSHAGPDTHRLPESISNTVRDAISVTRQLGFQYLWIDRYCINQEDIEEMAFQISKMDLIYHGAEVTIVAAAGRNEHYGLPGVGVQPRTIHQEILKLDSCTIVTTGPDPVHHVREKSRWWTRGWTFQEGLLSRRLLIFTEHQTFFECNSTSWMEEIGGLELAPNHDEFDWTPWKAPPSLFRRLLPDPERQHHDATRTETFFYEAFYIIMEYTSRELSFDLDSLNGIVGCLHFMQRIEPAVRHISGLPCLTAEEPEDADLVTKCLFFSLCWYHDAGIKPRRRAGFPSWTWAGWAGPVDWMWREYADKLPALQDIHLVFRNGHEVPAAQHLVGIKQEDSAKLMNGVLAFRFRAQIVPPSLFMFDIREEYVDSGYADSSDEESENEFHTSDDGGDGNLDGKEDSHREVDEDLRQEVDGDAADENYTADEGEDENKDEEDEETRMADWTNWTVGQHRFSPRIALPTSTPKELLSHLEDGSWGCLFLGDVKAYEAQRFLLVVEWQDKETAARVGTVMLQQNPYVDKDFPNFFDTDGLAWQTIKLI